MVMFVFVVMMLNVAGHAMEVEREWLRPRNWYGPSVLALILLGELVYCIVMSDSAPSLANAVSPKQVGVALFKTYWIGVELVSLLLTAGLVGACHLGHPAITREGKQHSPGTESACAGSGRTIVSAGAPRASSPAEPDPHAPLHVDH